jgi:hypothetical protein
MRFLRASAGALAFLLFIPPAIQAQTQNNSNEAALIQDLLRRIDGLEKRVAELEGAPAQPKPAPEPLPVPAPPGEMALIHDHDQVIQPVQPDQYPFLHIAGFSDINFSASDQPGSKSGFTEGQFTLHLTSALSPRVNYFGEITFTPRADAGTGTPPATGFNPEVERSIIRFDQNDKLKGFIRPVSHAD